VLIAPRLWEKSVHVHAIGNELTSKDMVHASYLLSLMKVTAEMASMPYSMSAMATSTGALYT
jgi:hypothetical protein